MLWPETSSNTPVVTLQRVAPPLAVRLKLETRSPHATFEDRAARSALEGQSRCDFGGEAASAIALAAEAKRRNIPCAIFISEDQPLEVRQSLLALGVKATLTDYRLGAHGALAASGPQGAMLDALWRTARVEALKRVAVELIQTVRDDGGRIDAFVAGASTQATLTVLGAQLRAAFGSVQVIGVEPALAPVLSKGTWAPHRLHGLAGYAMVPMLDLDGIETIADADAWQLRARLGREEGMLVSPATAAVVLAASRTAQRMGDGARVYALATDTGERSFSQEAQFQP